MSLWEPDPRWEAFAAREPYFAVLSSPNYRRANLTPDREREFFASGEVLVNWTLQTIELRLVPHFAPASILEYGCGIGRLAIPFARRAASVTAVDRSPAMLDAARREAERRGAAHVDFRTVREFCADSRRFDLVNCCLVLQRLHPDDGLALLRQLIDRIGSGGVGVFHVPHRTTASRLVQLSRWLRGRLAVVNGLANLLRRKAYDEPYVASHTYDLEDVFGIFADARVEATHVVIDRHPGFDMAICLVQTPVSGQTTGLPTASQAGGSIRQPGQSIDVRRVIEGASIEELNQRAEDYFASLGDWEHHLAKPFSSTEEAPALLMNVATMFQGLQLTPGMTVLDFGAGTGWLARFLTQLGCRVILLDVSATALQIARELYDRLPIVGSRPSPEFQVFDGLRIALPDGTVDRIVCFDAFHHVPNPDVVLREFGRILKPGGIAGFAEPGPRHSLTPQSQFEMRTYGVVENDIDVHGIWRTAQTCGFTDVSLIVFHGPPFHLSLPQYEDFLTGGETCTRWTASTRGFLRHVRHFLLFKGIPAPGDSRQATGLACRIKATPTRLQVVEGLPMVVHLTVTNSGAAIWLPSGEANGGVELGVHVYDGSGRLVNFHAHSERLTDPPRPIQPGETVAVRVSLPAEQAGQYTFEFDCVALGVAWFGRLGSTPAIVRIDVAGAGH